MKVINLKSIVITSWRVVLLSVLLGVVFAGCAATKQAGDVRASGFLGTDVFMLTKGGEGEALRVYRNPTVNLAAYNNIILDPVTVWWGSKFKEDMDREDLQVLANNFYKLLYKELSEDYKLVSEPALNTLRVQLALTNVDTRSATMDVISTVLPVGYVVSAGQDIATGKHSFVGEATVEGKIIDSRTGELIMAGVDRRVGGKRIGKGKGAWADVNNSLEFWAKQIRYVCK
jgi:hypothetical protein